MTDADKDLPIDPQVYAAFIGQIELRKLWLSDASVTNPHGAMPADPSGVSVGVAISESSRWESSSGGFHAFHTYELQLSGDGDHQFPKITVTFGIEFASQEAMTDETFSIFSRVNLPINTWPFLREFFYSTLGRMGWVPITLPALKVGAEDKLSPAENAKPELPKSRRKRKVPATSGSAQRTS
jgi:hypothetical protein